jgi:hypothetical protein
MFLSLSGDLHLQAWLKPCKNRRELRSKRHRCDFGFFGLDEHTYRLPKEDDIWFDKSLANLAPWNTLFFHNFLHCSVVEWSLALDTTLRRKAAMRFYYLVCRDACSPFQSIDVLCET